MKTLLSIVCILICCQPMDICAQNAPVSIAGTIVSLETEVTVPVYAMNFNDISSCSLKLIYDPAIATVTSVTIGPDMGGMISTNLSTPGVVLLGWFTSSGINLPDSSVIFNLHTTKAGNGSSYLQWVDDGFSCNYSDGNFEILNDSPTEDYYLDGNLVFQSPDAPVTNIPSISALAGATLNIPVTVSNFQLIGALSLNLQYDPSVLTYLSFNNNAEFPGLLVDGSESGIIQASGMVPSGDTSITLQDNAGLFTLNFSYQGGFTELNWVDNGLSCHYSGSQPVYPLLNDSPQELFYLNGSVSENALPAGAGPVSGPVLVCTGATSVNYSVPVIEYATGYVWSVPENAVITSGQNTHSILVDFESSPVSGEISVYGTNEFGSGGVSSLTISSTLPPAAAGYVNGPQEVCREQGIYLYSVQPIAGANNYNWSLPYGSNIVSGINTNAIEVNFGPASISGVVIVSGSNICGSGQNSVPLPVTLFSSPQLLAQPLSPPAVYAGQGEAIFTLTATGEGLTYQWQEYNGFWNDLSEDSLYSGVFTDSLTIANPPISLDGKQYRCIVEGACPPEFITDGEALLTVLLPVGVNRYLSEFNFLIYPNPFNDYFELSARFIGFADVSLIISDISGRMIWSQDFMSSRGEHLFIRINTPDILPGIFLLKTIIKTENNLMMQTMKLVRYH
ncbi:MAG: hypothetical protein FD170_3927 [Bacteroidetes bacterium]|nr:MAG: hypothetical protein FD170_3927 [Bacteroidota bacterium]